MGHQLTAIVALFFITVVTCDECDYKKFTPDHTACISRNPNCDILDNQVTDDDKNMILELHNRYREKVAIGKETFWPERGGLPTASNMLEMEWDDELATVAQRRAETCEFKYDCDDCLKVDRFDVGQNLYRSWISESSSKDLWERMMKTFYNEVKNFNKEYVSSFKFQADYGRFSQLIWADSWRVGCGKVVYKDGKWDKTLVSCNYGPRGNQENEPIYRIGSPCSECPEGTCCGDSCSGYYRGLCRNSSWVIAPPEGSPQPASAYEDFQLTMCSSSSAWEPPTQESTPTSTTDDFQLEMCRSSSAWKSSAQE